MEIIGLQKNYSQHHRFKIDSLHDIYESPTSGSRFAYPTEVDKEIYNHIYLNRNKVPGYERYAQLVLASSEPLLELSKVEDVYWAVKKALDDIFIKDRLKKDAKILELGSGLGYLTYALSKSGYHATGMDISQEAVDLASKRFGNFYICDDSSAIKDQYDVIICTEVIEHVQDPEQFLFELKNSLCDGGYLIITTANKSSYSPATLWHTDPPPVHLWWFGEESFYYFAGRLQMELSFIDFFEFYKGRPRITNFKPTKPATFAKDFSIDFSGSLLFRLVRG